MLKAYTGLRKHRLLKEVVNAPSLGVFKARLVRAQSKGWEAEDLCGAAQDSFMQPAYSLSEKQ